MKYITRQEEYVLLTVHQLKSNAYLVEIQKHLTRLTGKEWSVSSIYTPLDKMEQRGYLAHQIGEPTAKRGGKAIKYYSLTDEGLNVLAEVKQAHDAVWGGASDIVLEK